MIILKSPLSIDEIKKKHNHFFETMVKIVIDIEQEILALDAELHADLEMMLLEEGSAQENLWGANIYINNPHFIEFTSLINIRPAQNNKGMEVEDEKTKQKIQKIVEKLINW